MKRRGWFRSGVLIGMLISLWWSWVFRSSGEREGGDLIPLFVIVFCSVIVIVLDEWCKDQDNAR